MRELRDPQNGCQTRKVPQNGYTFPMDSIQKGATTIQRVGPLPPAELNPLRLKYITMMSTKHTCILPQAHRLKFVQMYKSVYKNILIYSNLYWLFLKQQGKVPQYGYVCYTLTSKWVSFGNIGVPQNGSVSESSTHTSRRKLVKSAPRAMPISSYPT